MTVAILVPVLRRPHRVVPLLESIDNATELAHRTLFIVSPDDDNEKDAIDAAGGEWIATDEPARPGDYARKINLGYHQTWEPHLFLGADDLHFHAGWLEAALARLTDTVHVVGTNDLGNRRVMRGEHATHSLVTRAYVDRHGTIDQPRTVLHEGYHHNFVDNEFVATAQARNAWAFAADARVEHLHPNWGKGTDDDTYRRGLSHFEVDRRHFLQRRPLIRC